MLKKEATVEPAAEPAVQPYRFMRNAVPSFRPCLRMANGGSRAGCGQHRWLPAWLPCRSLAKKLAAGLVAELGPRPEAQLVEKLTVSL